MSGTEVRVGREVVNLWPPTSSLMMLVLSPLALGTPHLKRRLNARRHRLDARGHGVAHGLLVVLRRRAFARHIAFARQVTAMLRGLDMNIRRECIPQHVTSVRLNANDGASARATSPGSRVPDRSSDVADVLGKCGSAHARTSVSIVF